MEDESLMETRIMTLQEMWGVDDGFGVPEWWAIAGE